MRRTGAKQTSSTTLQYKRRPARPSESPQAGVASQRSPESLWTGPPRSVIGWEQPPGKSSLGTNTGEIQKAAGGSWSTPLPVAGGLGDRPSRPPQGWSVLLLLRRMKTVVPGYSHGLKGTSAPCGLSSSWGEAGPSPFSVNTPGMRMAAPVPPGL